jgi:chemotaxis protein MotA
MFSAVGVVILLVMVFGGFMLTGGDLGAVRYSRGRDMAARIILMSSS